MYIYVASSWRNPKQPEAVGLLRAAHYDVYDFRNPAPGDTGFHWSEIDPDWQNWDPKRFRDALQSPIAKDGFSRDMGALRKCDVCILLQPCGRSAHMELGWAAGAGKETIVWLDSGEPELMLGMAGYICVDFQEVLDVLERIETRRGASKQGGARWAR